MMTGRFYFCPRCYRMLVTAKNGGPVDHDCKED